MILIIVYFFIFLGLFYILLNKNLPSAYIGILIFITLKTLFNYRKCTVSYIECKLRKVKREEGYLNRFLDQIIDLRCTDHAYILYLNVLFILYYHFIIKKNKLL